MRTRLLSRLIEHLIPDQSPELRQRLNRVLRPAWLGTLRRTTPLSQNYGYDRGLPVDRYYIERFLDACRRDIRGRVLEVKDSAYTRQYGAALERCDVLDVDATNPRATIVTDLTSAAASGHPGEWDCFVLTQTLQYVYDVRSGIAGAHHLLRPGGVLLATVPAISRLDALDGRVYDYWRFTPASVSALFGEVFGAGEVEVRPYGNVLAAIAFLSGMASEELSRPELDVSDAAVPVIIAVRAVKR
jgi:SAM-dependent methyltransferase